MEITETFLAKDRQSWRDWLKQNSSSKTSIWLLVSRDKAKVNISYLDAVEEALCFGWIDGIAKVYSPEYRAQRFSPRQARSNWTELNKERCRRLIKLNLMTASGMKPLPDLDAEFVIPKEIIAALRKDKKVWNNFQTFPSLYQRVKISSLLEMLKYKRPDEYASRLKSLIAKTREGKMYGEWNDGGRLVDY